MLARLLIFWAKVRDSLWFIPGVLTLLAAAMAFAATQAEERGWFSEAVERSWIFAGGAEGARGVLSVIAGSLITVTGVVFSVTIVALQLASSQFTPRVLRDFTADRSNQVVLGIFIGTFTYTLLILRTVRSAADGEEAFVPRLGIALAVFLVMVSIACLIYFINHSARSIQASAILARVTERAMDDVHRLFPEHIGRADDIHPPDPRRPETEGAPILAAESGYLKAVDARALFELGMKMDVVIGMECTIGDFVLAGQPLVSVWPPGTVDDGVLEAVRTAFVLGPERTPEQDVEFGIIEISDIAQRALSPGINDPTTAIRCIDRLGQLLLVFGTRRPPRVERTREGNVHFIARYTTFERAVGLAFDQIRYFGATNPLVAAKLLSTLTQLVQVVPPGRHAPLASQAESVLRDARAGISNPADFAVVEATAKRLLAGPVREQPS